MRVKKQRESELENALVNAETFLIRINFAKPENLSDEKYEKVIRVLANISIKRNNIESRYISIQQSDELDLLIEGAHLIMEAGNLQNLAFQIDMIAHGMSGADRIAFSLRQELGERWYTKWKRLIEDIDRQQKYIVGLAYEIVFGNADERVL